MLELYVEREEVEQLRSNSCDLQRCDLSEVTHSQDGSFSRPSCAIDELDNLPQAFAAMPNQRLLTNLARPA